MKLLAISLAACAVLAPLSFAADVSVEAPKPATVESSKNWTFDGDLRWRLEQYNGYNAKSYGDASNPAKSTGGADTTKTIGESDDTVLMQRVIAGFTYKPTSDVTLRAHMQDSRAFGWSLRNSQYPTAFVEGSGEYVMNPSEEFTEITDANVEIHNLAGVKGLSTIVGRQSIAYGDKRIFGPGDWGNTGRWRCDAVKVGYKWDDNFIDVFGGATKTHDPDHLSFAPFEYEFKGLGMYSHFTTTKTGAIEPFYARKMSTSDQYSGMKVGTVTPKGDLDEYWYGARIYDDNVFNFFYDATYTKEGGRYVNTDVDAYGYTLTGGYHAKTLPWKPKFGIGYLYASGEKPKTGSTSGLSDGVQSKFEPAFGANDWNHGWMNIASWNNIVDKEVRLTLTPSESTKLLLEYHWYDLAEAFQGMTAVGNYKNKTGNTYDELGQEFNIEGRYQYSKDLSFNAWIGYFRAGEFITGNDIAQNDATWVGLQAVYKFKL